MSVSALVKRPLLVSTAFVLEKRSISADRAVRLACFFGNTEPFWLSLQGAYETSWGKAEHSADLNRIEPLKSEARI